MPKRLRAGRRGSSLKPVFLLEFTLVKTGAGMTYSSMRTPLTLWNISITGIFLLEYFYFAYQRNHDILALIKRMVLSHFVRVTFVMAISAL